MHLNSCDDVSQVTTHRSFFPSLGLFHVATFSYEKICRAKTPCETPRITPRNPLAVCKRVQVWLLGPEAETKAIHQWDLELLQGGFCCLGSMCWNVFFVCFFPRVWGGVDGVDVGNFNPKNEVEPILQQQSLFHVSFVFLSQSVLAEHQFFVKCFFQYLRVLPELCAEFISKKGCVYPQQKWCARYLIERN